MIFSKIWYLFNATTSITGEWCYEYMPLLIECELLTSTWQACIQKWTYAAPCLGLYYQSLRLRKTITKKISELENKKG